LRAFEDAGYVAIDNLPLPMFETLERAIGGDDPHNAPPLAIGVDVRSWGFDLRRLLARMRALRDRPEIDAMLVFLECDNEVLLRRFTETRRRHPLAQDRPVLDGIVDERRRIGRLADHADLTLDTSTITPAELRASLMSRFGLDRTSGARIAIVSFSFRRGLPREADMVFDVRFLRNPHYDPKLRPFSGRDAAVGRHVAKDPDFAGFFKGLTGLIGPLLPRFDAEGKSYLTVAVGCTGGRHRSVYVAERLAEWLRGKGRAVAVTHRDAGLETPEPNKEKTSQRVGAGIKSR
jgi:UPF0042 nucleotide-binding protein